MNEERKKPVNHCAQWEGKRKEKKRKKKGGRWRGGGPGCLVRGQQLSTGPNEPSAGGAQWPKLSRVTDHTPPLVFSCRVILVPSFTNNRSFSLSLSPTGLGGPHHASPIFAGALLSENNTVLIFFVALLRS